MKILTGLKRVKDYFLEVPLPDVVLQVAPRYLSGLRIAPRERKAGGHFLLPIPEGAIVPSFESLNFADPRAVESAVKEGLAKLGLSQATAAVLLPELAAKVFVLGLDSLPASPRERDSIIRWRVAKILPSLPDDARFAFLRTPSGEGERLLVTVARTSVIQEYEALLAGCGLAAGNVNPAFLNLIGILPAAPEGDALAVNVEDDSLGLAVLDGSGIGLYRQKPFSLDGAPGAAPITDLVTEIENTIHYLEDREKRTVRILWLRSGLIGERSDLAAELRRALPSMTVMEAGGCVPLDAGARDKDLLAPLYGHLT